MNFLRKKNRISDKTATSLGILMFIYILTIGQPIYEGTLEKQWDTPIFHRAGRGEPQPELAMSTGQRVPGWVWSDQLLPAVRLWARLDYKTAFYVVHVANAIGLALLVSAAVRRRHRYPYLAWTATVGIGYFASDTVASGNLTAMLAGAAITPIGALMVCCIKPWFGLSFVFLHAIARTVKCSKGSIPTRDTGGSLP